MASFIDLLEGKMAELIANATGEDLVEAVKQAKGIDTTRMTYSLQQGDYTGVGLVIYGLLRRHFLSRAMVEAEKVAERGEE